MIDAKLLPLQRAALAPAGRFLARRGVAADWITLAGFAAGLLAFAALAAGAGALALALIALNRLLDGLDGAVAREAGPTDRGAFLDIALDFMFYALVPLGFAFHDPAANALPAALLVTSFVGTGSSFLAFAAIAERRPPGRAASRPGKGIHYLGGLTEGFETILIFAAMCLWPAAFPVLAGLFAAACLITTLTRWHLGWTLFADR